MLATTASKWLRKGSPFATLLTRSVFTVFVTSAASYLPHSPGASPWAMPESVAEAASARAAELEALAARAAADATRVERAARALAVRAMELDNRSVEIEARERALAVEKRRFEKGLEERRNELEDGRRRLGEREAGLIAREASLRYSAVEQMTLHAWSGELERREKRVGDAENAEKERIAARIAQLGRRESAVEDRERRVDAAFRDREDVLHRRETAADAVREALNRQRAEAMLQIEGERSQFWAHQQKLSAVVAAETEALLAEQARLRTEFDGEAAAARAALRDMSDAVLHMRVELDRTPASSSSMDAQPLLSALRAAHIHDASVIGAGVSGTSTEEKAGFAGTNSVNGCAAPASGSAPD